MSVRPAALAGGLLIGTVLTLGAAAPALAAPCDAYSRTCANTPPGIIDGNTDAPGSGHAGGPAAGNTGNPGASDAGNPAAGTTGDEGRSLPFTGAELILTTMLGGAAVAGGTVLVLAGRRRARSVN